MTPLCAAPPPGLAAGLLAQVDCVGAGLAERAYAALAAPGGEVATALTGLMVVAVALFGWRLLLGHGLALADAVGLALKLGVVIALAGAWGGWQPQAYDLLARAPTHLAEQLTASLGARPPLTALDPMLAAIDAAAEPFRARAGSASPLIGGAGGAAMALNLSATVLTLTTVGVLVAARALLALLLALTPAAAATFLFAGTRGMAERWLRGIAAAALAPIAVLVLAALELAVATPMLGRVLGGEALGAFDPQSVTPFALTVVVFGLATLAAVRATTRIASGIRLPRRAVPTPTRADAAAPTQAVLLPGVAPPAATSALAVTRALERATRADAGRGAAERFAVVAAPPANCAGQGLRFAPARDAPGTPTAAERPRPALPRTSRAAALRDAL